LPETPTPAEAADAVRPAGPAAAALAPDLDREWAYLPHAIVFLASAGIMVIELVAGRLIGSHLGSSLYTWTSIIGVVMAGMSVGNYVGGRWADRYPTERLLCWLLLASAASALLVLGLNHLFAGALALRGLNWPLRILLTVSFIFFLPAMVLGTVTPVTVKMALERSREVGASIGSVYAWGTVGSIAGTMATGFILVQFIGASRLVQYTAVGLALTAVLARVFRVRAVFMPLVMGVLLILAGRLVLAVVSEGATEKEVSEQFEFYTVFQPLAVLLLLSAGLETWRLLRGRDGGGEEDAAVESEYPAFRYGTWAPHAQYFAAACVVVFLQLIAVSLIRRHLTPNWIGWIQLGAFTLAGPVLGLVVGRAAGRLTRPERFLGRAFLLAGVLVVLLLLVDRWKETFWSGYRELEGREVSPFGVVSEYLLLVLPGFLLGLFPPAADVVEGGRTGRAARFGGSLQTWGLAGVLAAALVGPFSLRSAFAPGELALACAAGLVLLGLWLQRLLARVPVSLCVLVGVVGFLLGTEFLVPKFIEWEWLPRPGPEPSGRDQAAQWGIPLLMGLIPAAFLGVAAWRGRRAVADAAEEEVPAPPPPPPEEAGGLRRYAPQAIVFCSAACLMAMEMDAGRMLARHMGSSIYTWTSVIGVVLAGMTAGYFLGGWLSDRWNPANFIGWLCALASLTCLTSLAVASIFRSTSPFSNLMWPTRILITTASCFFLPALFLGSISPSAAKLALSRSRDVGATIGSVYAWGTIGSIFGTLLTGFWLIAALGAQGVLLAASLALALLAVCVGPHRLSFLAWMILVGAFVFGAHADPKWLAPETRAKLDKAAVKLGLREDTTDLKFSADSNYQYIKVYEKEAKDYSGTIRVLTLDYLIHAYVNLSDPSHLEYDYEHLYRDIMLRYANGKPNISAYFFGGGGYTFPRWIQNRYPDARIEVAEIDPQVVEVNHLTLGLPRETLIRTTVGDARNALDSLPPGAKFDFFYGDAYNDFSVPWHLTTVEFCRKISDHMTDDGAYLMNVIDDYRTGGFLGASYLTLKKVFPCVYVFCTNVSGVETRRETFVIAASKVPLRVDDWMPNHGGDFEGSVLTEENLAKLAEKCGHRVLTDDCAPVENLLAPMIRTRR
jgi:spermidine synthase